MTNQDVIGEILDQMDTLYNDMQFGPYKVTCPAHLLHQEYYEKAFYPGPDGSPLTVEGRIKQLPKVEAVFPGNTIKVEML
jgi:hypothetical protein